MVVVAKTIAVVMENAETALAFAIPTSLDTGTAQYVANYVAPTTAPGTEYAIMELVHVIGLTVATRAN